MTELSVPPLARSVLNYWFGGEAPTPGSLKSQSHIWFSGSKNVDFDIERRFGKLVSLASSGLLDSWAEEPAGGVALIILLDQFPRNIFRGSIDAFAYDRKALHTCYKLIEQPSFTRLNPVFQSFALLPLEHSESMEDQDRCVAEFERLLTESAPEWREMMQGYLDYAEQHRKIIQEYGRFPHRNKVLGRESTPEEEAYLEAGALTFGQ